MSMSQLIEKLDQDNVKVTGRMIRHYISLGLLPEPEYPHQNQAIYTMQHYILIKIIDSKKKLGLSLNEIKDEIKQKIDSYLTNSHDIDIDLECLNEKQKAKAGWSNIDKKFYHIPLY